ncbi:MAG TPA: urate hydroxylase PuuD [Candidatus Saccharimonadales bacterium]|nr:urate hydroxylase PuuD [Candidatus Saccharimonadales bacterium]
MDVLAYAGDWLHLVVRWLHVTAAIAWVGASFYFIALDQSLRAPRREGAEAEGVGGDAWEIHGGGFYRIEKYRIAPRTLPAPLAWFKWEAYTTWLTGFALMVLLYYVDPSQYLIDPNRPHLQGWELVTASLAIIIFGWLAYDLLARSIASERVLTVALIVLTVVIAALSGYLFSPRGAFIQVGATLGTWMAANVFFVIIPGQRALVAATAAGTALDPGPGIRGKQRSVHNNYLTLPVLFAMISQHFPFTYGHDSSWVVLLAFMALGALVRHAFNLRHQGRDIRRTLAVALAGGVALIVALAPQPQAAGLTAADFPAVQQVFGARCVTCHSSHPTNPGFSVAPKGVMFDTQAEIVANAQRAYEQVVVTKAMPLGNVTGITDAERDLIGRWVRSGAPAP